MPIRVKLDQVAINLWRVEISRGPLGVICHAFERDEALERAVRVWRVAAVVKRAARKKLN